MFFKLALKNVTKSLKDYSIYFLTLCFGVCIFYVFGSLDSQSIMSNIREAISMVMGVLSVFVSFVLAGLILYANKYMMRRRKKELGLYMLLGMGKRRLSLVLLCETFLIGLLSLVTGLILGVLLSQGISILTASLFSVTLTDFHFVFSMDAFLKTILYFGIIFIVVMVFNSFSVSKTKLIDLFHAGKKNEKLRGNHLWMSVIFFILSAVCLFYAYKMILHNQMMLFDAEFFGALLLGSIGTVLFFLSLSGFLLKVVQSCKRLYYKNLNLFTLRQFSSKIRTTYLSMSFICIMLPIIILP